MNLIPKHNGEVTMLGSAWKVKPQLIWNIRVFGLHAGWVCIPCNKAPALVSRHDSSIKLAILSAGRHV